MHVIATAGHVDHGKSALVRALTGMEPDRWSEERRRGMTIDLGYAWTSLPSGEQVAFVDVPGHERFASNMLAGVGPVPAVLLVVAADSGWAAQTEEHTAAVAALGVRHGLLVATRADLADPAPALAAARERMSRLGLAPAEGVATSAVTGEGLAELRAALDRLLAALPAPDRSPTARVRLWIDRAFTIRGAGTVVTGTLGAGRLLTGQTLQLSPPGARPVTVRGLESLGQPVAEALAVSRVAVNLRGLSRQEVRRGQALLTPDSWLLATEVDARMVPAGPQTPAATDLATQLVLHIGSAGVPVSVRPLAADLVRLRLATPLPLQVGDRALLRDPGRRRVVAGALVLDPDPPSLGRRGAATARARELASDTGRPEVAREVARRGAVRAGRLLALGCDPRALAGEAPGGAAGGSAGQVRRVGDWLVDERVWRSWQEQLRAAVRRTGDRELFARGLSRAEAVAAAGLADPALLDPLLAGLDDVASVDGRVRVQLAPRLPAHLAEAIAAVRAGLAAHPFAAPEAAELARLGLGHRELAAARDAGEILLLPGDVVLAPDAATRAAGLLAGLPAPFTLSQARQALGTTRRVAVPLLEHLDQTGVTLRVDATGRRLR